MIQKLDAKFLSLKTDSYGNQEISFAVDGASRFRAKALEKEIKETDGKELLTLEITWHKDKRSLDQNALMWKLLTEYALGLGGGRTGDTTPEDLYYQALSKYGVAEFIMTVLEAEETLKNAFRVVKKVDTRTINGKELGVFKCYYGSSTYDTKQMSNLIDGILDDMSQAGISTPQARYLYEEWREYAQENKKAANKSESQNSRSQAR